MGKNRVIKILGGIIGGLVAHKILLRYTNRPESLSHLQSEVDNYRENALEMAAEFNWNADDKNRIKKEALKNLRSELDEPHFRDVQFSIKAIKAMKEAERLVAETLDDVI